jgi:hypothetical protein
LSSSRSDLLNIIKLYWTCATLPSCNNIIKLHQVVSVLHNIIECSNIIKLYLTSSSCIRAQRHKVATTSSSCIRLHNVTKLQQVLGQACTAASTSRRLAPQHQHQDVLHSSINIKTPWRTASAGPAQQQTIRPIGVPLDFFNYLSPVSNTGIGDMGEVTEEVQGFTYTGSAFSSCVATRHFLQVRSLSKLTFMGYSIHAQQCYLYPVSLVTTSVTRCIVCHTLTPLAPCTSSCAYNLP